MRVKKYGLEEGQRIEVKEWKPSGPGPGGPVYLLSGSGVARRERAGGEESPAAMSSWFECVVVFVARWLVLYYCF